MNEADGDIMKAAKQRKMLAALHQTRLVKMWLNRQELAACDQAEQQQMDEEAAAINEMEEVFKGKEKTQEPQCESEVGDKGTGKHGRRPWQYVQIKVPAYKWEMGEGEHSFRLKPDTMPTNLKEGQQSWWYDKAS